MLSKNQARLFFLGGTVVFFLVFLVLSANTLSSGIPRQTHADKVSQAVIDGKILFDENNCMGCHTILGEGAYYAPELTKVVDRRGAGFIKAVLTSKQPWTLSGRKMVAYGFNDKEASDLIAFFTWIGEIDLNGFPPEPDLKK
ncbi:MAG: cytochrome c [Bacteroidales bacterium]|nr:cytochrome c [Bacteroidales bacterium]